MERKVAADGVEQFLSDWTRSANLWRKTFSRLHVAMTRNTADKHAEELYHTFLENVFPPSEEADQKLKTKLMALGVEPPRFGLFLS